MITFQVVYGELGSNDTQVINARVLDTTHMMLLSPLTPGTTYNISVINIKNNIMSHPKSILETTGDFIVLGGGCWRIDLLSSDKGVVTKFNIRYLKNVTRGYNSFTYLVYFLLSTAKRGRKCTW